MPSLFFLPLQNILYMEIEKEIKIDNFIRSNRRSVSLEIRGDGKLTVRVPLRFAYSSILDIVREKAEWINKKQQQMKTREHPYHNEKYFLGKKYDVISNFGIKASVSFDEKGFFITVSQHRTIEALLSRWYKIKTIEIVLPRVAYLAGKFGLEFSKVSISIAKRRWGSCNKRRHITFSFRLIMLPSEIIDYIIIHELAHLVELNHSRRFWTAIQKMMPVYKQHEKWLKHNGYKFYL